MMDAGYDVLSIFIQPHCFFRSLAFRAFALRTGGPVRPKENRLMLGSRSAYKKRHRYYRKTDSRPDQAYGMQFQLPRFTNFSEKVHDNQAAALTQYAIGYILSVIQR